MELALFNSDGLLFLFRWFHFFFGVLWIGHLYYFNFTQGPFFAETDASTKSGAIQKLLPRALWWFRWGAMFTFLTGWLYLGYKGHRDGLALFTTSWGLSILLGAAFGTLMFANVWLIIWPAQKIVIASATQAAKGGAALPQAPAAGARALLASRTNALFSIPMLFFMGAASHLPFAVSPEANFGLIFAVFAVLLGALELNAIKGKLGPMTTVRGVITSGFALTGVTYVAMELLVR